MSTTKRKLAILTKRADFLERRIAQAAASGGGEMTFDRAEMQALRWAVQRLSDPTRTPHMPTRPVQASAPTGRDDSTEWG